MIIVYNKQIDHILFEGQQYYFATFQNDVMMMVRPRHMLDYLKLALWNPRNNWIMVINFYQISQISICLCFPKLQCNVW